MTHRFNPCVEYDQTDGLPCAVMVQSPDGVYVAACELDRLRARCARLEGALMEMQAEANTASEWLKAKGDIGSACNALDKAVARARGAVGQ